MHAHARLLWLCYSPLPPLPSSRHFQTGTFWLAVVCTISLMEAWVKASALLPQAPQCIQPVNGFAWRPHSLAAELIHTPSLTLPPCLPACATQFRAPLLDRWVGVDVGRRVFRRVC